MCFTDHVDIDFPGVLITFDTKEYTEFMKNLRKEYSDRIDIRMGVEVGMQPHIAEEDDAFVKSAPFDFVIGSTHVIDKMRPQPFIENQFKDHYPYKEGVRVYFEDTLKNIQVHDNFDVYGHLDYIANYTYGETFCYEENVEIVDEILKLLISKGKGLELNTSQCHLHDMGRPCDKILMRYRELGGEIITMGSDAHSHKHVGNNMDIGFKHLRQCGFKYFTVFKDRKPEFISL